jgi:hypothetical protein
MLKLGTLKWKGRCKRHPRYDPVDGEGAIRGGCEQCQALLDIYMQHRRLLDMIRAFGPMRDRARKRNGDEARQRSLFDAAP